MGKLVFYRSLDSTSSRDQSWMESRSFGSELTNKNNRSFPTSDRFFFFFLMTFLCKSYKILFNMSDMSYEILDHYTVHYSTDLSVRPRTNLTCSSRHPIVHSVFVC